MTTHLTTGRVLRSAALGWAFVCLTAPFASAQTPPAPAPTAAYPILPLRIDENYDAYRAPADAGFPYAWKHVALSDAPGGAYVSFGGEARYKIETAEHPLFGLGNARDFTSDQARMYFHGDVHFNKQFRAFVQLAASDERGRRPRDRAVDESALDVAQAFLDAKFGEADAWRLRAGRQELSFGRYITVRDGTNLRRTFDGLRLTGPLAGGSVDVFGAYLTLQRPGYFDDKADEADRAWGVAYTHPLSPQRRWIATYFGRENERASYAAGAGIETRHALAIRYQTANGPWDFDGQFSYQFGTLDRPVGRDLDIDAWGFATETGYTLKDAQWSPRFAVRLDAASGDKNAADGKLGTFELAYPNLTYISDATTFAARNLIGVQPFVTVTPNRQLTLTAGTDFLWRMEGGDSVYAPPTIRLTRTDAGGDFVASQPYLRVSYKPNPFVEVSGSAVASIAEDALKAEGLRDQTFATVQVVTRF